MQTDLIKEDDFNKFISHNPGAMVYFSTSSCNVCKVLKPKIIELLIEKYPNVCFAYVDCEKSKELCAQNGIFAVPTILFFMDGKEIFRKSRNMGLEEIDNEISRPYSIFFN